MSPVCPVALSCAMLAIPALAQTPQPGTIPPSLVDVQARMNAAPDTTLPPVTSLSCEQMQVELRGAGSVMKGQLDPNFAADAERLHQKATTPRAAPATAEEVARNHARVNQIGGQLAGAMQGIDLQRMMALSNAFTAKSCKTPQ